MTNIISAFWTGLTAPTKRAENKHCRTDKKMRDKMTEDQLDRMLAESCDASDPITMY